MAVLAFGTFKVSFALWQEVDVQCPPLFMSSYVMLLFQDAACSYNKGELRGVARTYFRSQY